MKVKERVSTVSQVTSSDERKWVKMLADGVPANEIAEKEKKNKNTFAFILNQLRAKYNCTNSNNLVAYFLRNKLID